ncbi:MAG: sigma 54-interacting transcriptional regulator [Acidobacteriota bacterium]
MATQTIDYTHQIDRIGRIEGPLANLIGDEASQVLIKDSLIGSSRWAENARRSVALFAAGDETVIFEGEPGTGKKFLARLIHQCSAYREGPFVSLSLGSTADDVARAVLFGWTPARSNDIGCCEKGLVELAHGGTLYIDGLSSCSPAWTDDLIRLIERRAVDRDGEGSVRILLGWSIQSEFRARVTRNPRSNGLDYERIQIPPLRERPDDVEALAMHFIRQRCQQMGKELRTLSRNAMEALRGYDWPRNVRELRTLVNHLVKQSPPPSIDVPLLPAYLAGSRMANSLLPAGLDLDDELKRYEIDLICSALRDSRGLQIKAARLLRTKPTTLFMKIRRYGIDVEIFKWSISACRGALKKPV